MASTPPVCLFFASSSNLVKQEKWCEFSYKPNLPINIGQIHCLIIDGNKVNSIEGGFESNI